MKLALALSLSILVLAPPAAYASASDICEAVALHDAPAVDFPTYVVREGEHLTAITQHRIDTRTGEASFCSHHGYCYPEYVLVDGLRVQALKLTNCKVGARDGDAVGDYVYDWIEVIRSKNKPSDLRANDVEIRLVQMGLCNACATIATYNYINHPASKCAKLTKSALEGNPVAIEELLGSPNYCKQIL